MKVWFELWSKGGASPPHRVEKREEFKEYIKGFNWLKGWTDTYFFNKGLENLLSILFLSVLFIIIFYRNKKNIQIKSNYKKEDYLKIVEKAKKYIHAGDIFQVVPSQRFHCEYILSAKTLYRSLRRLNPSPFLVNLNFDNIGLVASSPEILVRVRDGKVTIRPIAGTRKRGKTTNEDRKLSNELLNDQKELAEHLMLLDLGRNDVGRVAKVGTVSVTEKMIVEYYSHVMHIVSNVEGDLKKIWIR